MSKSTAPHPASVGLFRFTQAQARLLGLWDWLKDITGVDDSYEAVVLPRESVAMAKIQTAAVAKLDRSSLRTRFNNSAAPGGLGFRI